MVLYGPREMLLLFCLGSHRRAPSLLKWLPPELLKKIADHYKAWFKRNRPRYLKRLNKEVQDWRREPQSHDHFRLLSAICESPSLRLQANRFPSDANFYHVAALVGAVSRCELKSIEQVIIVGPRSSPYAGGVSFWI